MNIKDSFNSENKQLVNEHFINLIQIALADGIFADTEKELLIEVAINMVLKMMK